MTSQAVREHVGAGQVTRRGTFLAEMTTEAVGEYVAKEDRVILPFGSMEENGRHLPTGSDTIVATAIAIEASARTGVAIAPAIPWGNSWKDMSYPGTMAISAGVMAGLVTDICATLATQGMRRIAVISGHQGDVWTVASVAAALRANGAVVAQIDVWRLTEKLSSDLVKTDNYPFGHGSEMMTSMMLSIEEELVDRERMTAFTPPSCWAFNSFLSYPEVMGYADWKELSPEGTMGDPTQASPGPGAEALDRVTTRFVQMLDDMREAVLPEPAA
jgi:creatinine amidohydrolase